jgi:hypothetical protein
MQKSQDALFVPKFVAALIRDQPQEYGFDSVDYDPHWFMTRSKSAEICSSLP